MLAETVVGRTQGDVGAAVAILETATAMLTQGAGAGGPPMGGPPPIMANMGGPLYRDNGGDISDNDILKQMIMESLQSPAMDIQRAAPQRAAISTGDLRRYANGGAINPELKRTEQAEFSRGMQALANRFS